MLTLCLSLISQKQEEVDLADGKQGVRQGTMCFQWLVCADCTLRGLPQPRPRPRPSRLFSEAVMETFRGIALTSASKLGGTANVMDDIITIPNEFSCLEYQPRTNQVNTLMGVNVKSCVILRSTSKTQSDQVSGKQLGQFGLTASSVGSSVIILSPLWLLSCS